MLRKTTFRFQKGVPKNKHGYKDPLKVPRRTKEYKYMFKPHMAGVYNKDIWGNEKPPDERFALDRDVQRFNRLHTQMESSSYRVIGVADPMINELYIGRLNTDWVNPFPTLSDEVEVRNLMFRRGDMMDKLHDIEQYEEDAMEKLKMLNILNLDHHMDIGGQGMSEMESLHMTEILSKDLALLTTFRFQKHFGIKSILYGATDTVLSQYMEDVTSLKRSIGYCLVEPEARSDISMIQTRAWREGPDHWSISGKKSRVLVYPNTDLFVVFAQVQKSLDEESSLSAFLVDLKDAEGNIEVLPADDEIHIDGLKFATVIFNNVTVPDTHVLGDLGGGFHLATTLSALSRASLGAEFAEIQKTLLQYISRFVHQNKQFGKKLSEFPLVQQRLTTIAENVYASESMAYMVTGKFTDMESVSDFGLYASECAAVQLKCKELAIDSIQNVIELMGTKALAPGGKEVFDKIYQIYASSLLLGSTDVLKMFIGHSGFQSRFHFDQEYFIGRSYFNYAFGKDRHDETKSVTIKKDYQRELNNFTTSFKERSVAPFWQRDLKHKIGGITGGRWTEHAIRPGHHGWLEPQLIDYYDQYLHDVDDFGKRTAIMLSNYGAELENLQIPMAKSADVAVNLMCVATCIGRANKSVRLGYNYYEDEISLLANIVKKYSRRMQMDLNDLMPWTQKNELLDSCTKHIGKQVIHAGMYPFQHPLALDFDYSENMEYLNKLDDIRQIKGLDNIEHVEKKISADEPIDDNVRKEQVQEE